MKYQIINLLKYFTSIVFLCGFLSHGLAADLDSPSNRSDRWEASFQTRFLDSINIGFEGGAEANFNDDVGWAVGLGYNYTEHWAFNFDFSWNNVDYAGTRIDSIGNPQTVSGSIFTSSTSFGGIYHFSAKRFTPFIGASMGWTYIDTNIPNGVPQTICWYDPWWGYICDTSVPTKTSTSFSYGTMLGLRFDITEDVFLRGSVGKQWIDYDNTTGTPDFTSYRFDIGFMF